MLNEISERGRNRYETQIMTLNLRYDKPDPGDLAWKVRCKAVAAMITHYTPDVIGTQEALPHQLFDLLQRLPAYQCVGGDRTGRGTGEHCAIFYRIEQLLCISNGDFFLSDTPDIPGSISGEWGNPIPRMTSWAVFAGSDESRFSVFNTHLDYRSARARELGAQLIFQRMSEVNSAESLLLLTGDFNAEPATTPRETFLRQLPNEVQLFDVFAGIELEDQMTFHDFTGEGFAAVDTIYYDSRLMLQQVTADTAQWEKVWPSDHFPIIAEFTVDAQLNTNLEVSLG
ncbi:MAG: endonuclease/exonuclease/phosphatase family protein [Microcoleus vaginatus WJT46-NPBG5]|nr:endonuclease/exonuclease/phosphatase family protein [Microcoleus vaginatus WJT46-NPBG5]